MFSTLGAFGFKRGLAKNIYSYATECYLEKRGNTAMVEIIIICRHACDRMVEPTRVKKRF